MCDATRPLGKNSVAKKRSILPCRGASSANFQRFWQIKDGSQIGFSEQPSEHDS